MAYKDLVPVGTALVISATSFGLGVVYAQWPYDLNTLWRYDPSGDAFAVSLKHYQQWANSPMYVHYLLHFVGGLGLLGSFIKLYKPHDDAKYFEYGSLGLFLIAIIIYLTNLRIGINSTITGEWGDIDGLTGLNVMAALEVMIVLALVGVLVLQGGLYYAEWYDNKLRDQFFKEEAERAKAQAEAAEVEKKPATEKKSAEKKSTTEKAEAVATGVEKKKAKKRKD